MKKSVIIGLAATTVAGAVASLVSVGVSAGPLRQHETAQTSSGQTKPPHEITASVRAAGFDPDGAPRLRGRYYVLRAINPRGVEMRVLADAQGGEILSILPVRHSARTSQASYTGGARIIHVPQPSDAVAKAGDRSEDDRDDLGVPDAGANERPSAVRPVRPANRPRSEAPRQRRDVPHVRRETPHIERHLVTSAPPPPPQAGDKEKALTPVYPTPRFGAKADDGEKFDPPPRERASSLPPADRLR